MAEILSESGLGTVPLPRWTLLPVHAVNDMGSAPCVVSYLDSAWQLMALKGWDGPPGAGPAKFFTSVDGDSWTEFSAPWTPRSNVAACVFGQSGIGMFGGDDRDGNVLDEYWYWSGGWRLMPKQSIWPPARTGACLVNTAAGLWLFGGDDGSGNGLRDVWVSSSGGCDWRLVTAEAPWSGRWNATAIAQGESPSSVSPLWMLGGFGVAGTLVQDRAWSFDGSTWTRLDPAPAWSPRASPNVVTLDGRFYLFGGVGMRHTARKDLWASDDLRTWVLVDSNIPSGPIPHAQCALHHDGNAYLVNGSSVWRISPAAQVMGT